jgi:hypothetical protein
LAAVAESRESVQALRLSDFLDRLADDLDEVFWRPPERSRPGKQGLPLKPALENGRNLRTVDDIVRRIDLALDR